MNKINFTAPIAACISRSCFIWSFVLAFGLMLSGITAQAQGDLLIDEIVAIVGDNIILRSDVEIQTLQAQSNGITGDDLSCQVLDQLLLEKMFLAQAAVDSVMVSEDEVEASLDGRLRYFVGLFGGDQAKMEQYYGKSFLEIKEEMRDEVRDQLLAQRMQQIVVENVKVTPKEVRAFYESIPQDSIPYLNAEVELSQLVIEPSLTKAQKEAAKDQLLLLKSKIESGEEDFARLAGAFSEDPGSASNGGDLGWVERGTFVPEFDGAAFRLAAGELSDIVETQFGFHLIEMIERRGNKINCRHILIKPQYSTAESDDAIALLDSVRNLVLTDSLDFKDAVAKYSTDDGGESGGGVVLNPQTGSISFEMDQLDPNLYFTIDTLKKHAVSKPVEFIQQDGSTAYRIIRVDERTSPHVANLKDDYDKLKTVVQSQKQQTALYNWIEKKAPRTYVKINDDGLKSCVHMEKWVKNR